MNIDFLLDKFAKRDLFYEAIIYQGHSFSYSTLLNAIIYYRGLVNRSNISDQSVVSLEGDFSLTTIAMFFVLLEKNCIIVPLIRNLGEKKEKFLDMAQVQYYILVDADDNLFITHTMCARTTPELYQILLERKSAGLVVFSSGSTGKSKGIVHDMTCIMEKFKTAKGAMRTLCFLLFDHLGGINTMLHVLATGGCLVIPEKRDPFSIAELINSYEVELLPTSPTFINLLLLSEAYDYYDLSSLKLVTYGTEPMYQSTLDRFHKLFPNIRLKQTYGLSEIGVMKSKSKSNDSLWVKVGGEGFQTRVVDGILEIKAESAMLGYLNAPSPFTEDGWLITGDKVELDGEWVRILGRESSIINVGGMKVYPAEVENVLKELDIIAEVTVYGDGNPITGQIVVAKIRPMDTSMPLKEFTRQVRDYTVDKLEKYKRPVKVILDNKKQHTDRFKKEPVL